MTDTPDLRTLADVFVRAALDCGLSELPPGEQRKYLRGLAAVLPAVSEMLLAQRDRLEAKGYTPARCAGLEEAADIVRRLASAAPETAPRPRQDDETAPAVRREATQAQRATGGADERNDRE